MARACHFSGDVNHRCADLVRRQHGTQPVGVVNAVLQAHHQRIGLQKRLYQAPGRLGIAGLHAKQNHVCTAHGAGLNAGLHLNMLIKGLGLQAQPGVRNGGNMLRARNQHHRVPCPGQHAAVVAAHGARAHHGKFQ